MLCMNDSCFYAEVFLKCIHTWHMLLWKATQAQGEAIKDMFVRTVRKTKEKIVNVLAWTGQNTLMLQSFPRSFGTCRNTLGEVLLGGETSRIEWHNIQLIKCE